MAIDFGVDAQIARLGGDDAVRCVIEALGPDLEGVHLVGGAARDLLLGVAPTEIDLVVESDPQPIGARLANRIGGELVVHERFATAKVVSGLASVDIARARSERYDRPGALPEVEPAGLEEDLRRRDFTVNAIAIALHAPIRGQLTAAPRALEDLEERSLRILHRRSFRDDPTRLWRLARYRDRLGFAPDPGTGSEARAAVEDGVLSTVTTQRHAAEFARSADAREPISALRSADDYGLLRHIGAGPVDPVAVGMAHDLLARSGDLQLLRIACAFAGGRATDRAAVFALGLPHRLASCAADALEADGLATALQQARRPSEIDSLLRGVTPEIAATAGARSNPDGVRLWWSTLRGVETPITGDDLIEAGVPAGPRIAEGLDAARRELLDRGTLSRAAALEVALRAIDWELPG